MAQFEQNRVNSGLFFEHTNDEQPIGDEGLLRWSNSMSAVTPNSTSDSLPKLGRSRPIHVITIFAKGDDKRHLLDRPDLITVHNLNPRRDLEKQWDELVLDDRKPDLILTKLHKALGSREYDDEAETIMKNYEELRKKNVSTFARLELVPLETELILTNRSQMQHLIAKVCTAVNTTLNCRDVNSDLTNSKIDRCSYSSGDSADIEFVCHKPQSCKLLFTADASLPVGHGECSLPPFPLVVKPASTSVKSMAVVFDTASLQHFLNESKCDVVVEEYVPHNDSILKVYVIGKDIFVIRRPSLPDLPRIPSIDSWHSFAEKVLGDFIAVDDSGGGGYVVFQSDKITKRHQHFSSLPLEKCTDLDVEVFRLLTQALARELLVDLFGFDVLLETGSQRLFVVDVNVLPGYKGVPSSPRRICEWLAYLATRKAYKEDCRALLPQDLLRLSLLRDDEESYVDLETLQVKQITRNRIFEVSFREKLDSPGAMARHTLVKFRPVNTPRRFVADKDRLVVNLCSQLAAVGQGPAFVKDVSAVYFDRRRQIGLVRQWVEGKPLHAILSATGDGEFDGLHEIFRGLGRSLARFHLLIEDSGFQDNILRRHFPGILGAPVSFRLLEQWRRDAVLSLQCSSLDGDLVWRSLVEDVILVSRRIDGIVAGVLDRMCTPHAMNVVFGHFDTNTNNIIVSAEPDGAEPEILLIDEEWAAPNVAVYDFAKLVTSINLAMSRGATSMTGDDLRRAVSQMVAEYLSIFVDERRSRDDDSVASNVENFVEDVWTFVPLAALTNCFSNLIHASKEGQMRSPPPDNRLMRDDGTFSWLRHASDHLAVFNRFFWL